MILPLITELYTHKLITRKTALKLLMFLGEKMRQRSYSINRNIILKVTAVFLFLFLLCPKTEAHAEDSKKYVLGGYPFGAVVYTDGVYISSFTEPSELGMQRNPSAKSGLKLGDIIKVANGSKISTTDDLCNAVVSSNGKTVCLSVKRGGEEININVKPIKSDDGTYRLGINVKDSVAGIGTITYICKEDGTFGGLGHGICDAYTGEVIEISKGSVRDVNINNIVKSENGRPGEIRGSLIKGDKGLVLKNTQVGVFGKTTLPENSNIPLFEAAKKEEITCGEVTVYCSLDKSGRRGYTAVIESLNQDIETKTKNFTLRITDPELIRITGGIVQGMSGSPIIQNGKLIGAVTHVCVNDPTRGYGIFIENMLNAA